MERKKNYAKNGLHFSNFTSYLHTVVASRCRQGMFISYVRFKPNSICGSLSLWWSTGIKKFISKHAYYIGEQFLAVPEVGWGSRPMKAVNHQTKNFKNLNFIKMFKKIHVHCHCVHDPCSWSHEVPSYSPMKPLGVGVVRWCPLVNTLQVRDASLAPLLGRYQAPCGGFGK